MNRSQAADIAHETVALLGAGSYTNSQGQRVDLRESLEESVRQTRVIAPGQWRGVLADAGEPTDTTLPTVEITAETTLQAGARLVGRFGPESVMALNFASARNPGGGFLNGSRAQEESIARASGLYPTLLSAQEYYTQNRENRSMLYTDYGILSPRVPVFRDDNGAFLNAPYLLNVLTMPAPNRREIRDEDEISEIGGVFRRRIINLLALAAREQYAVLILGAWGCGAFHNEPKEVAAIFREVLFEYPRWSTRFRHICFAIYDTTPDVEIRNCFTTALAPYAKR